VQAIVGGISTPIIAWISNRVGKRKTIMGGLALAVCSYLASWWLFDPQRPWLQVFFNGTVQPALMTVWVLNGSIIADICDDDELRNGYRREGMFGAIFTFITKAAPSGIVVLMGYVLLLAGFREGEEVTPETVWNLRVLFIVIPVVLLSIAIVLAQRFPITEAIARWTRAQLDERHTKHESPVEEEPVAQKE
jgi:GPH family glycoside/pentoside/hexuronide:cation symporter